MDRVDCLVLPGKIFQQTLGQKLRSRNSQKYAFIQKITFFSKIDKTTLGAMLDYIQVREVMKGNLIYAPGSLDNNIYVVISGELEFMNFYTYPKSQENQNASDKGFPLQICRNSREKIEISLTRLYRGNYFGDENGLFQKSLFNEKKEFGVRVKSQKCILHYISKDILEKNIRGVDSLVAELEGYCRSRRENLFKRQKFIEEQKKRDFDHKVERQKVLQDGKDISCSDADSPRNKGLENQKKGIARTFSTRSKFYQRLPPSRNYLPFKDPSSIGERQDQASLPNLGIYTVLEGSDRSKKVYWSKKYLGDPLKIKRNKERLCASQKQLQTFKECRLARSPDGRRIQALNSLAVISTTPKKYPTQGNIRSKLSSSKFKLSSSTTKKNLKKFTLNTCNSLDNILEKQTVINISKRLKESETKNNTNKSQVDLLNDKLNQSRGNFNQAMTHRENGRKGLESLTKIFKGMYKNPKFKGLVDGSDGKGGSNPLSRILMKKNRKKKQSQGVKGSKEDGEVVNIHRKYFQPEKYSPMVFLKRRGKARNLFGKKGSDYTDRSGPVLRSRELQESGNMDFMIRTGIGFASQRVISKKGKDLYPKRGRNAKTGNFFDQISEFQ